MNRNCSACNIKIDTNNYKKDRTVCKTCYNRNKRKNTLPPNTNIVSDQQPKIEKVVNKENNTNVSAIENHAYLLLALETPAKLFTC